ncbi:hypothetical protein X943_001580 [Babesia divergens]|uniref:4Fe-4S ferredoxin-type domain-containing protein n=1 Tax=Babesia divergens TaxID=32595 RepID=A0AAD9G6Y4_BABDI|nr:hypothetical protein X943_001580 [Babesia divergens]
MKSDNCAWQDKYQPCSEKLKCSSIKRGRHLVATEDSAGHIDDVMSQPARDDAFLTDTSIASSLTSGSVTDLPMQMRRGKHGRLDNRGRTDKRTQYADVPPNKRSLWQFSVYQQLELLDELLCSLGQCYPRWKHRRFGLQRFYCHKFNIHFNAECRSNYIRLMSKMWDGFESTGIKSWRSSSIWLQLLTQEYQLHLGNRNHREQHQEYSNSPRVEELLQQLDEVASCFCSDRCAMDFMRHSSYWGNSDSCTFTRDDETLKQAIGECFASAEDIKQTANASKISTIVSYYKERGFIHNFTRPYEYKTKVITTPAFNRSVVCLGCGRICWCMCERKIFRLQGKEISRTEPEHNSTQTSDTEPEEITDIHEFVNTLHHKKQIVHHHVAQTAITVSHSRQLDGGVVYCYNANEGLDESLEDVQPQTELKKQLLRATVLRGSLDDVFMAITPRKCDMSIVGLTTEITSEWKTVPPYRSWRKCWWRLVNEEAFDKSDANVKPFVSRALERLDALGNVRYNLDYGCIAVGYIQRRARVCSYWRHFYVSKLGLWKAFTRAVEYNLMMSTLPLELQLDSKTMHWTVCKCHQGDMFRKSFSAMKHGLIRGYGMALMWYESFLRELKVTTTQNSDIDDESDVGCDDFDEQLFLKTDSRLYEGVNTVEGAFVAARKRKIVLAGTRGYDEIKGMASRTGFSVPDTKGIVLVKEHLMLDHNLWYKDLAHLFPSVNQDIFAPTEPAQLSTLRNLLNHYPDLRDYFTLAIKHLDECVYTLKMCVNNTLTKGSMEMVEPILQINDDKKLADVIPQVPMQWVSFHRNSDSWTCVLECKVCLTCAPRTCVQQESCVKFQNSKEVIDLLCKKFSPCSVKYSAHPFYKDSPGNTTEAREVLDDCFIAGFSVQKFGFNGAKALATEFRKRFVQIVYSSMKYDGSFSEALLGIIAEEIGLLTSTDAYILPNKANEDQRQSLINSLLCGVCSTFGDRMQHKNGTVLLKQLVKSSVPGKRLCEVFALGQMAYAILHDVKLDIKFCNVHMAWVVWWLDCMQQKRVMFYRVEDLINVTSLEEELADLEKQWMAAISAHVEYQHQCARDTYQPDFLHRFEEAFRHLTSIADSRQEFKLIKRLWQINRNEPGDMVAQEVNSHSFALTDAIIFPFGALHDEGTPPLSETE